MKKAISIRLDPKIIDFFRFNFPEGYQTGISKVLETYVGTKTSQLAFALGRAQQNFLDYHTQCFWYLRPDLKITAELLPMVKAGLRKNGGRKGMHLAAELELLTKINVEEESYP